MNATHFFSNSESNINDGCNGGVNCMQDIASILTNLCDPSGFRPLFLSPSFFSQPTNKREIYQPNII